MTRGDPHQLWGARDGAPPSGRGAEAEKPSPAAGAPSQQDGCRAGVRGPPRSGLRRPFTIHVKTRRGRRRPLCGPSRHRSTSSIVEYNQDQAPRCRCHQRPRMAAGLRGFLQRVGGDVSAPGRVRAVTRTPPGHGFDAGVGGQGSWGRRGRPQVQPELRVPAGRPAAATSPTPSLPALRPPVSARSSPSSSRVRDEGGS